MKKEVFVYGTLLSNEPNHGLLHDSRFLGPAKLPGFVMYSMGVFPFLMEADTSSIQMLQASSTISGEVYEVDEATSNRLDRLEGYPHMYQKKKVGYVQGKKTGQAFVYYMAVTPRRNGGAYPLIRHGCWKQYLNETIKQRYGSAI